MRRWRRLKSLELVFRPRLLSSRLRLGLTGLPLLDLAELLFLLLLLLLPRALPLSRFVGLGAPTRLINWLLDRPSEGLSPKLRFNLLVLGWRIHSRARLMMS